MKTILHKPDLRKAGSLLLLLVFTLGITPKKTLHDWFANHKDYTAKTSNGKIPQLTKSGYNCQVDDLVAESHFITTKPFVVVNMPALNSFFSNRTSAFISTSLFHFTLRGPPLQF